MSEQRGAWFNHDGKGCPAKVGEVIEIEAHLGNVPWGNLVKIETIIKRADFSRPCWTRRNPSTGETQVVRYRIRKPRGLTILDDIIADLPQPAEAETTGATSFQ